MSDTKTVPIALPCKAIHKAFIQDEHGTLEVMVYDGGEKRDYVLRAINSHERLVEAVKLADSILWMAEKYAEGGGSNGPEMQDYRPAEQAIRAALKAAEEL